MSAGADLEDGYRRWLRWYPEWFRREYGAELLGMLMAGTRVGQRRPEPMECLDLVRGGLCARLRPRVPRSDRCGYWTVKLMYVGAAVELAVAVTVVATMSDIRSNILAKDPGYTAAQWRAEVSGTLVPLVVAAVLAVGFWVWMAWATGRRHRWVTVLFAVFFVQNTYNLLRGLAGGSATYARPALVAGCREAMKLSSRPSSCRPYVIWPGCCRPASRRAATVADDAAHARSSARASAPPRSGPMGSDDKSSIQRGAADV